MISFFIFCILLCTGPVYSGFISTDVLHTPCEYDEDCPTPNSFCKGNTICSCKKGYEYDDQSDICFPKEIGLKCIEDYDCSAIRNSYCSNGLCICKGGYVSTEDKASCLPMSRLTLNCVEDVQCRTEHSVCDLGSQQCICENGYHEVLDTHECLQNYGYNTPCNFTRECYVSEDQVPAIACAYAEGTNIKKCLCAEDYEYKNSRCEKSGSAKIVMSVFSIIVVTLASLIL